MMNRFFTKGSLVVLGSLLMMIVCSLILRIICFDIKVRATVYPYDVEIGKPIYFSDSTLRASDVLWEFGNGDVSHDRCGSYVFRETGNYQVRLTVDGRKNSYFMISVRDSRSDKAKRMVKIIAPSSVVQNERVVFMADGDSDHWRWEFGESGQVDSQERNPIYVYSKVGVYDVKLTAANMMYPIVHTIEVMPEFAIDESTDPDAQATDEFKERLQQIIDGKNVFNANYNYLLKHYLSGNSNVIVLINGTNENDFYSYCNGLKIMGKQQSVVIMDVNVERDNTGKIKRLLVNQVSSN